jgi:hypothetical protein
MKRAVVLSLGLVIASGVTACEAPSLEEEPVSKVESSTIATYAATKATTTKFGIVKWRLRHSGDGQVLEGLDKNGKSVSHVSIAVREGANEPAAMVWFGEEKETRGFVKGNTRGMAAAAVPQTLPEWATAAAVDLDKFAEEGRTPYGCADDLFGVLGGFLQSTAKPECAKTDSMQGCISKLMQDPQASGSGPLGGLGGIGGILGNASKLLTSCKPGGATGTTGTTGTSGTTGAPADLFGALGGLFQGGAPPGTAVKQDPAVNNAIGPTQTTDPFDMGALFGGFF